jgi:hypothetical protein
MKRKPTSAAIRRAAARAAPPPLTPPAALPILAHVTVTDEAIEIDLNPLANFIKGLGK